MIWLQSHILHPLFEFWIKSYIWLIGDSSCFCGLSGRCSCAPTCKCPQWQLSIVSGVRTFLGSVAGYLGSRVIWAAGLSGLVKWVPGIPMHCKVMPYGLLLSMILRDISWVVWYKWAGSCLRFPDSFFFSISLIRCDRDSAVFAYWIDCLLDEDRSQFQNTLCQQRQASQPVCLNHHILALLDPAGAINLYKRERTQSIFVQLWYLANWRILNYQIDKH